MIRLKFLLLFLFPFISIPAQHQFQISDGSADYNVKINIETCSKDECEGKATIDLYNKKTSKLFQTLKSDNLNFT